ncbi:MAG: hypothetical protein IT326_09450 [Anaerolineae bacterium]|nr:hypothetical protein [Anaerolineae bacterium]
MKIVWRIMAIIAAVVLVIGGTLLVVRSGWVRFPEGRGGERAEFERGEAHEEGEFERGMRPPGSFEGRGPWDEMRRENFSREGRGGFFGLVEIAKALFFMGAGMLLTLGALGGIKAVGRWQARRRPISSVPEASATAAPTENTEPDGKAVPVSTAAEPAGPGEAPKP